MGTPIPLPQNRLFSALASHVRPSLEASQVAMYLGLIVTLSRLNLPNGHGKFKV